MPATNGLFSLSSFSILNCQGPLLGIERISTLLFMWRPIAVHHHVEGCHGHISQKRDFIGAEEGDRLGFLLAKRLTVEVPSNKALATATRNAICIYWRAHPHSRGYMLEFPLIRPTQ